jgi:hypothetical protein
MSFLELVNSVRHFDQHADYSECGLSLYSSVLPIIRMEIPLQYTANTLFHSHKHPLFINVNRQRNSAQMCLFIKFL